MIPIHEEAAQSCADGLQVKVDATIVEAHRRGWGIAVSPLVDDTHRLMTADVWSDPMRFEMQVETRRADTVDQVPAGWTWYPPQKKRMSMLKTIKFEEVSALLAEATPGEWFAHGCQSPYGWKSAIYVSDAKQVPDCTRIASAQPSKPEKKFIDELGPIVWEQKERVFVENNAAAIVAAVNWCKTSAPKLVTKLAAAEVQIERMREALREIAEMGPATTDHSLAGSMADTAMAALGDI